MKRFAALMVVLILAAGALMLPVGDGDGEAVTVVVRSGDTLGKLAKQHGTSVAQLREWNTLNGDLIQVGQELTLSEPTQATRPLWRVVRGLVRGDEADAGGEMADPAGRPGSKSATRPRARPGSRGGAGALPDGVYPTDDGRFVNDDGMYVNRRGQPVDEDGDVIGAEPGRNWPPLARPAAKQCLDAFTGIGEGGDTSFGRSEGLSGSQVSGAVARFQEQTLRCADGLDGVAGTVSLELVIGCDGRVKEVSVMSDGVGEGNFAGCVADVMRYAPFPAHARDEVTVQIPLRYD